MHPTDPIPLSEAHLFFYFYGVLIGPFHLLLTLASLLLAGPIAWLFRGSIWRVLRDVVVFHQFFFLSAALFHTIWSCTIWGNLYFSTDYVVDFLPFLPILPRVIEAGFAHYESGWINHGLSLVHLNLIWAAFAIVVLPRGKR